MVSSVASLPTIPAPIANNQSVRVTGSVEGHQQNIPAGADGTVVATLQNGATYEVQFGPPVNAVEPISSDILAIA
jgi:hypothetical protein